MVFGLFVSHYHCLFLVIVILGHLEAARVRVFIGRSEHSPLDMYLQGVYMCVCNSCSWTLAQEIKVTVCSSSYHVVCTIASK